MIRKLGNRYRVICTVGAVITIAAGIGVVVAALNSDDTLFIGLGAAALIAIGGWLIYQAVIQGNIKDVLDYCKNKAHPDYELERIEQFYKAGEPVRGLRIGNEFFMYIKGNTVNFAETRELVWAYKSILQHKTYGINSGKSYSVVVKLNDGSSINIGARNEKIAEEMLEYMAKMVPYIAYGYTDQLNDIYNKQLKSLERNVDERRHAYFQDNTNTSTREE
jgi:hypothetical protein